MEEDSEMDNFMQTCLVGAKKELEQHGDIAGLLFFRPKIEPDLSKGDLVTPLNKSAIAKGKPAMGLIPLSSAPNKDAWYRIIGQTVKGVGAKFTVMVMEAWVSINPELTDKGEPQFMPSQDPNRKEAIAINGVQYDNAGFIVRSKQITVPFEKDNDKYVYLDATTMESIMGGHDQISSILADVTARDDLA